MLLVLLSNTVVDCSVGSVAWLSTSCVQTQAMVVSFKIIYISLVQHYQGSITHFYILMLIFDVSRTTVNP